MLLTAYGVAVWEIFTSSRIIAEGQQINGFLKNKVGLEIDIFALRVQELRFL